MNEVLIFCLEVWVLVRIKRIMQILVIFSSYMTDLHAIFCWCKSISGVEGALQRQNKSVDVFARGVQILSDVSKLTLGRNRTPLTVLFPALLFYDILYRSIDNIL